VRVEVTGTRGHFTADYVGLQVTGAQVSGMPGSVQRLLAGFSAGWQHGAGSIALVLGVLTRRIQSYMGLRTLVREFYRSLRVERRGARPAGAGAHAALCLAPGGGRAGTRVSPGLGAGAAHVHRLAKA
jgi:hypothetical protein